MIERDFFVTTMPSSRPADYYLGYSEGSVFLDFDNCGNNQICLRRISFDGYGCCDLGSNSVPLSIEDSKVFKNTIQNNAINQSILSEIVTKAIMLNKLNIWTDALNEYGLV